MTTIDLESNQWERREREKKKKLPKVVLIIIIVISRRRKREREGELVCLWSIETYKKRENRGQFFLYSTLSTNFLF